MSVRDLIQTYRERRGWTQREAARRMGFDNSYLSMIEASSRPPSVRVIKAIEAGWELTDEEGATLRAAWWEEA
jgi:transcriptional regulator with XRE-family HTH domain